MKVPTQLLPDLLTSARIVLAVFAVVFATRQQIGLAATVLLLGFATDAVDGSVARALGVANEFGKLLDFFADYVYFVFAPALTGLAMLEPAGHLTLLAFSVPCVCGAVRYARKAQVGELVCDGLPSSPGVPTIGWALFVISVALLRGEEAVGAAAASLLLHAGAIALGLLMVARTPFPKLSARPWILLPVLAGLALMPFVFTAMLAGATLALLAAYIMVGPLLVRHPESQDGICDSRRGS